MPVAIEELIQSQGKKVVLHIIEPDETLREAEGTIEAASEAGIAFKEKGKSGLALLLPNKVESVQVAPEKPKAILQKKVKPITLGQARQHLVDRHGVTLEWAKGADEKAAFEYHEGLDHSNLGHKHEVPEATKRDKALADEIDDADTED